MREGRRALPVQLPVRTPRQQGRPAEEALPRQPGSGGSARSATAGGDTPEHASVAERISAIEARSQAGPAQSPVLHTPRQAQPARKGGGIGLGFVRRRRGSGVDANQCGSSDDSWEEEEEEDSQAEQGGEGEVSEGVAAASPRPRQMPPSGVPLPRSPRPRSPRPQSPRGSPPGSGAGPGAGAGGELLRARPPSKTSAAPPVADPPVLAPLASPGRPPRGVKRRRRPRSFLEKCLHQLQQPEAILLTVWWVIIFCLTVYLSEMGSHLHAVWRPLLLLASIPALFSIILCIVTL